MTDIELVRKKLEEIQDLVMADSVLLVVTKSDLKNGETHKLKMTYGNSYASEAAAREWLRECDEFARERCREKGDEWPDSEEEGA